MKFNKNLKAVLPYATEPKLKEYKKLLDRKRNGEIEFFKIKFITPPVLYKKQFNKEAEKVLKEAGYMIPADHFEFNDEYLIHKPTGIKMNYTWIDAIYYYLVKESN